MKYIKNLLNVVTAIIILCSCNKSKLNQPALALLEESALANKNGVDGLLIGAYALLDGVSQDDQGSVGGWQSAASNWLYGSICGSEAHPGTNPTDPQIPFLIPIESFSMDATNYYFDVKWAAVYAGVVRANTVLRVMRKAKDMTASDTTEVSAEARFLRAFYHFEAKKMWNRIPFVDETVTYGAGNYYISNDTSWFRIENDFRYAMEWLPPTQSAVGRANKYAAEAFLAKAFLFQQKYAEAKPLLDDLINNGMTAGGTPYALNQHYADNFNPQTKNSYEAVFSVQSSVNDGSFGNNGNTGDALNFPYNGGPGICCGFFQPSQWLVNHFKTDANTGLPDPDTFNDNNVKNDEGFESDSSFAPYTGTLDPRLDWTVGRRGVPYLDWGPHPGKIWVRDQNYMGPYAPKKNVYSKGQYGHFADISFWSTGSTANNVNLIRYADILLWAAEVEVEIGDLKKAQHYVNMVRGRAADPSGWVKNDDNIPYAKRVTNSQAEFDAINDPSFKDIQSFDWVVRKDLNQTWVAITVNPDGTKVWNAYSVPNYKVGLYETAWTQDFARKAVRYERVLELAMEGHRFFDLVRWGIADQEINAYLQKEMVLRKYLNGASFTKNKNEYFPIPQREIDLSVGPDGIQRLKQNPGY